MKYYSWSICLLIILLEECFCVMVKYDGDQVLKVTPQTTEQVQRLQVLTNQWKLDLWKPDAIEEINAKRDVYVRVQSSFVQQMKDKLAQQQIPYKIMIEDVQKLIDGTTKRVKQQRSISLETYQYTEYHPMEEIYNWMELIKEKHSNIVTQHLLSNTYEERPIYYFKIGLPSEETKKVIFMDCGIHAREWIAVAYCQWFVKEIIARQNDNFIRKLLRQVDFYVVPVLNVDGYIYSWTTDRLWRKNRSPQENGTCFGVDLNRNFDSHWGSVGAAKECDSLLFCGPSPASEFETQGISNLVQSLKSNLLMYLTIHSFGQLILLPYGHTYLPSVNHYEMTKVAEVAAAKMKEIHNADYIVGSSAVVLYYNSGSSADWAADLDIKFSYTYELRDEGSFGFELPPNQIQPTCEETFISMLSLFDHINENYLEPLDDGAVVISSPYHTFLFFILFCIYFALIH